MNYLNINTDILTNDAYMGAEPVERATWFNLMVYCAIRENGGTIENAREWKCRKWQQLAGVTLEEVQTPSKLYGYENDNLMVFYYPSEQEATVKSKRTAGKKGGRPPKPKQQELLTTPEPSEPSEPLKTKEKKPYGYGSDNHMLNKTETERKGKERNRKGNTPLPPKGEMAPAGESMPLEILKNKINALKPEWSKPARWTYTEEQNLCGGAAAQMEELTADDWGTLTAFMSQRFPQGAPYWQPRNRSKFVDTFADVWASAHAWAEKHRRRPVARAPKATLTPRPFDLEEFREDAATYCAENGLNLTVEALHADSQAWSRFMSWMVSASLTETKTA